MSIDLDDIERRIADGIYGDDRMTKEGRNDAFSALNEIIAEVERLREEAHTMRLWAEEAARAENANAEDVKRECAAVVAWLRKSANDTMLDPMTDRQVYARTYSALHRHADMIERGEHRREDVASAEDDDDEDPSPSWRFCEGCGCRKETARYRSWSDHAWCSDCTSRE